MYFGFLLMRRERARATMQALITKIDAPKREWERPNARESLGLLSALSILVYETCEWHNDEDACPFHVMY